MGTAFSLPPGMPRTNRYLTIDDSYKGEYGCHRHPTIQESTIYQKIKILQHNSTILKSMYCMSLSHGNGIFTSSWAHPYLTIDDSFNGEYGCHRHPNIQELSIYPKIKIQQHHCTVLKSMYCMSPSHESYIFTSSWMNPYSTIDDSYKGKYGCHRRPNKQE